MFSRKRQQEAAVSDPPESTAARIRAELDLEERKADASRIKALTTEWRRIRERNNIAAAFEASMRGRRA